jgi:hypothetical protein
MSTDTITTHTTQHHTDNLVTTSPFSLASLITTHYNNYNKQVMSY